MALAEKYVSPAGAGAHDGSSSANAFSWTEMVTDINAGGKAGNRYNYAGSVSQTTTTDAITGSGSATAPVIIRGCSSLSSIGDGYLGRTNGNGALITTNMGNVTYTTGRLNITGTFIILESLNITGAPSARTVDLGADSAMRGCKVVNSGTNAASAGVTVGTRSIAFDCDIALTGASGGSTAISVTSSSSTCDSCRITVGSGQSVPGVIATTASVVFGNTIFAGGGNGISMTSTSGVPFIRSNTIVANTGDGINIVTGTTVLQRIIGNMITDQTGDGLDMVSTANSAFFAYNRTRGNANAVNNGGDWITATSYGEVTSGSGTSSDYTNYAGNDYSLVSTSAAVNAGSPLYAAIGALQLQNVASGGGGVPVAVFGGYEMST